MSFKSVMKNDIGGGSWPGLATQFFSGAGNYAYGQFTGTNQANKNAERNYQLEKENLEYQKWLQLQIFSREDSAIQRRVNDYMASGMSPILSAGGSGAGAGSAIKTEAPQREYYKNNMVEAAAKVLSLMTMKADVSQTFAESALKERMAEETTERAKNLAKDTEIKDWDLSIAKRYGMPYNSSTPGRIAKDAASAIETKIKELSPKAKKDYDVIFKSADKEMQKKIDDYYRSK